ncbi:hypothetical protein GGU10DRAFT_337738 [Lentinula aff. detonsa]|uniref:Uncharacterized protein n=1 Tax=Lentinula aff. detonsa TaxID=2804958 RepID=A0AA38KSU8_9AGAR|nr:hypothetical protein GGU10DRAFT_337738 [Lentinula aff. detonsa]
MSMVSGAEIVLLGFCFFLGSLGAGLEVELDLDLLSVLLFLEADFTDTGSGGSRVFEDPILTSYFFCMQIITHKPGLGPQAQAFTKSSPSPEPSQALLKGWAFLGWVGLGWTHCKDIEGIPGFPIISHIAQGCATEKDTIKVLEALDEVLGAETVAVIEGSTRKSYTVLGSEVGLQQSFWQCSLHAIWVSLQSAEKNKALEHQTSLIDRFRHD